MTALKGRDIPVQGNALRNGPKTTSPEGAAYSHGRGRLPVRCNPLSLLVGCLRLSSSAGDASAKARLHRWGDAVPASCSDGAWYCGADIPVCPRIRAQTGMSVPLWAAFVDGIDTVATCRYLAISLGSTGRIGSTAVPGSRTRKSEAPPITNHQSQISNLKFKIALGVPDALAVASSARARSRGRKRVQVRALKTACARSAPRGVAERTVLYKYRAIARHTRRGRRVVAAYFTSPFTLFDHTTESYDQPARQRKA